MVVVVTLNAACTTATRNTHPAPLVIQEQGSFAVGGTVVTAPGNFDPVKLLITDFSSAFTAQADFTAIRDRRMRSVSFNYACLVSANFHNVEIIGGPDRRSSFTGACLLGTNFSSATLTGVTLTNAKLSSKAGSIKVILEPLARAGELKYEPTQLSPDITGPSTLCADGRDGPCTREHLITDVPDTWSLRS